MRTGKLTTIVFIRDKNGKNQEVSGYIDLAHRMRTEDFTPVFECKKRLLPKPSDLSYFNWETNVSTSNSTPHYQVIADSAQGLLFKNKRDRKIVNVNPESAPGDNRSVLATHSIHYSLTTYSRILLTTLLTYPTPSSSSPLYLSPSISPARASRSRPASTSRSFSTTTPREGGCSISCQLGSETHSFTHARTLLSYSSIRYPTPLLLYERSHLQSNHLAVKTPPPSHR